MAEECLLHAMDLSGLLLLYSSLGDAEGLTKLTSMAKEQGKNNVAFLCFFMLGKLEECLQLLIERYCHLPRLSYLIVQCLFRKYFFYFMVITLYSLYSNRIPEAALMSRSYLPSKVPDIVTLWKKDLQKVPSALSPTIFLCFFLPILMLNLLHTCIRSCSVAHILA